MADWTTIHAEGGRLDGTVSSWSGTYGFLMMVDGRRAYVHTSQCAGLALFQGETVSAELSEDQKNPGKWQACNVLREGGGAADSAGLYQQIQQVQQLQQQVQQTSMAAAGAPSGALQQMTSMGAAAGGRMEGTVSVWNGTWGFIQFNEGIRAYVHMSQCGGEALLQGQSITGELADDPRNPGKWQAVSVERIMSAATALTGRLEGTVATWNPSGNFGFIHFSDGRRAYVHHSQTGGLSLMEGMAVVADLVEDPKNVGKWQALNVESTSSIGVNPANRLLSQLPGFGAQQQQQTGAGGAYSSAPAYKAHQPLQPPPQAALPASPQTAALLALDLASFPVPPGYQLTPIPLAVAAPVAVGHTGRSNGVVASWDARGFGFAMMEDGRRCYVHTSQCGGEHLIVGEAVSGSVVPDTNNPGKFALHHAQKGQYMGEEGTVEQFNDDKGFGFLMMDDGRRCYIHRSVFGGAHNTSLPVGSRLRCTLKADARNPGKWCVESVLGDATMASTSLLGMGASGLEAYADMSQGLGVAAGIGYDWQTDAATLHEELLQSAEPMAKRPRMTEPFSTSNAWL